MNHCSFCGCADVNTRAGRLALCAPCRAALPGALAFGSDELLLDALLPCLSDLAQVDPAVGISPEYVEPPQAKPGAAKGLAAC